jgi:hypothetical protein
LNTSEQKNESKDEIDSFLTKRKYHFDYSFENIDSTSNLLTDEKYRINDSNVNYSYIQLRVYDSIGKFYSGYSQCMGDFNKRNFIDSFPPSKNTYPFLNNDLNFENELDLIYIDSTLTDGILKMSKTYDYTFVVYWNIWTNYFSKHVLREVSKMKRKHPNRVLVIFVNTAIEKSKKATIK